MAEKEMLQLIISTLKSVDEKVNTIDEKVNSMDTRISKLEGIIENEVVPGIKVIAEGHVYANRHSNNALFIANEVKSESETQEIRLRMLEGEVEQLKRAVGI